MPTVIDRLERTLPVRWATATILWTKRHLVDPWLTPTLRPLLIRQARRRITALAELRAYPMSAETRDKVDAMITTWTRILVDLSQAEG